LYLKLTTGICRSKKRLDGKTVIVTGANTGEDMVRRAIPPHPQPHMPSLYAQVQRENFTV
jgi:hypothetical protein